MDAARGAGGGGVGAVRVLAVGGAAAAGDDGEGLAEDGGERVRAGLPLLHRCVGGMVTDHHVGIVTDGRVWTDSGFEQDF